MSRWVIGGLCVSAALLCLGLGIRFASGRGQGQSSELKPIGLPAAGEWCDIKLPVTKVECSTSGCVIDAFGLQDGKRTGLRIKTNWFGPDTSAKRTDGLPNIRFKDAGVVFEPQGEATINLLHLQAKLYGHPVQTFELPKEIPLTAATLGGDPDKLRDEAVKLKVFHGGDEEGDPQYFELFVNFHLDEGYVELAEKDPDYRLGVLRSFGAHF